MEGFELQFNKVLLQLTKDLSFRRPVYCPKKTEGEHFHGKIKIYLTEIRKHGTATTPRIYPTRTEANQAAAKVGIETLMMTEELEAYINFERMKLLTHDKNSLLRCLKHSHKECNSMRAKLIETS